MNKKITIQLILLVVLIILSIIFYNKYFFDQKLENTEIIKIEVEEKKKQKDDKKTDNSNIIENLKYTSKDLLGNTYIVEAVSAKFFDKQEKNEVLEEDTLSGQVVGIENKIITNNPTKKILVKLIIENLASIFNPRPSDTNSSMIGISKKLNP